MSRRISVIVVGVQIDTDPDLGSLIGLSCMLVIIRSFQSIILIRLKQKNFRILSLVELRLPVIDKFVGCSGTCVRCAHRDSVVVVSVISMNISVL